MGKERKKIEDDAEAKEQERKASNVVIDEDVGVVLRRLVRIRSQLAFRELRGKVEWEGDLDAMRENRFHDIS